MASIVTHQFRRNGVQSIFDEMVYPSTMINGCSSTGAVITAPSTVSSAVQNGMLVVISTATSGALSTSATIVTAVSAGGNTITVSPAPIANLSGALLSFYHQYYVGIGKSDPFAGNLDGSDSFPGVPVPSERTSTETRANLIALQRVLAGTIPGNPAIFGNAGLLIPRFNWTNNTFYKAWDPSDPTCFYPSTVASSSGVQVTIFPCFVVSQNKLFLCATSGYEVGGFPSSNDPATITTGSIGTIGNLGTNGYRWIYVSDIGLDSIGTLNAAFLPGSTVSLASITTNSTLDSNQFIRVYRNATTSTASGTSSRITTPTSSAGVIYSMRIAAGGAGYKYGDSFTIDGDGVVTASGIVTGINTSAGGTITAVQIGNPGYGYTIGSTRFTSGTGKSAVLIPRIGPINGFGYDVASNFPSWYAGFYATFPYSTVYPGTTDVPGADTIRQVSLIRNPVVYTSTTGSTYTFRCLKYVIVNTSSASVSIGDVIEASNLGRGFVDYVDSTGSNSTVYYHQNSSTFNSDVLGSLNITPIPLSTGSFAVYRRVNGYAKVTSSYAITSASRSEEYEPNTGEVIFIQNRTPITQVAGQNVNVTVVTQF